MLLAKWVSEVSSPPAPLSKVLGDDKASVEILFKRKFLRLGGPLHRLFNLYFTVFVATMFDFVHSVDYYFT